MSNRTRAYIQKEIDQRTYVDWTNVKPSTKLIITVEDCTKDITYTIAGKFISFYKGAVIVEINNLQTIYAVEPKKCKLANTDCQWK